MAPHTESNQFPVSTQLPRDWKNYSLKYIKLNVNDVKIIFKKKINCKVCVRVGGGQNILLVQEGKAHTMYLLFCFCLDRVLLIAVCLWLCYLIFI